jgi:hypothetical protein
LKIEHSLPFLVLHKLLIQDISSYVRYYYP